MSNLQINSNSLQTQILIIFEAAVAGAGRAVSVFWVLHLHLLYNLLNLYSWVGV
jgi:hypothetical protein